MDLRLVKAIYYCKERFAIKRLSISDEAESLYITFSGNLTYVYKFPPSVYKTPALRL